MAQRTVSPTADDTPYYTLITAKRRWFDVDLKELWRYRDLIRMFVKKDFSLMYQVLSGMF